MFKKIANDGRMLLVVYLATVAVGTFGLYFLEPVHFVDALYWASTTMTTTGYGDVAPKTAAGKTFAILFQQWAIVIVLALTIAWVLGKVNKDAFTDEEQESIKAEIHALREELRK